MKYWKCPSCKKERFFEYGKHEKVVMNICLKCEVAMEVIEDD